jgi:hypothetical protein
MFAAPLPEPAQDMDHPMRNSSAIASRTGRKIYTFCAALPALMYRQSLSFLFFISGSSLDRLLPWFTSENTRWLWISSMVSSSTTVDFIDFLTGRRCSPHEQPCAWRKNGKRRALDITSSVAWITTPTLWIQPIRDIFHYHAAHEADYRVCAPG